MVPETSDAPILDRLPDPVPGTIGHPPRRATDAVMATIVLVVAVPLDLGHVALVTAAAAVATTVARQLGSAGGSQRVLALGVLLWLLLTARHLRSPGLPPPPPAGVRGGPVGEVGSTGLHRWARAGLAVAIGGVVLLHVRRHDLTPADHRLSGYAAAPGAGS